MTMTSLTADQIIKLESLPDDIKVVGTDRGAPLLKRPTGQIQRLSENGKLTAARYRALQALHERYINAGRDL